MNDSNKDNFQFLKYSSKNQNYESERLSASARLILKPLHPFLGRNGSFVTLANSSKRPAGRKKPDVWAFSIYQFFQDRFSPPGV
jgi:hypothetical protein